MIQLVQRRAAALALGEGRVPVAVRYGWPISQGADTCCPYRSVTSGREPCVPASCPILDADTMLPASPFYAVVDGGRCRCTAPQVC